MAAGLVAVSSVVWTTSCGPRHEPAGDRAESIQAVGAETPPAEQVPWFSDVTAAVGLEFTLQNGADPAVSSGATFQLPGVMAGGVAVFDCDGDADEDLLFVNSGPVGAHRLFLNNDGRFSDATAASGISASAFGMGAAVADFDRDGDLDLYLTHLGPDRLLRNDGRGHFEDAADELGLISTGWSTSAAFLDHDGDGWLDLYVVRYVQWDPEVECAGFFEQPDWCGPKMFAPQHDQLFINGRGAGFRDASDELGLAEAPAAGLGVACADFDGDGRTDVFVANDAEPNQLWLRGDGGRLRDAGRELGAALNGDGNPEAGMGVVAAPFTRTDSLELLLTHLRGESNTLYRRPRRTAAATALATAAGAAFADATATAGLAAPSIPFTGFGLAALDLEFDGDLDLAVVNGGVNRFEPSPYSELPAPWCELAEPDHLFLNDGGHFTPAPDLGGPLCRTVRISRGLAAGDLDGDGDLDLVATALLEPARMLRNDAPRTGRALRLRVLERPGPGGTRADALGAHVLVYAQERVHLRVVTRSAGYLSSSSPVLYVGLGSTDRYDRVEVTWADGERSTFPGGPLPSGGKARPVTLERP